VGKKLPGVLVAREESKSTEPQSMVTTCDRGANVVRTGERQGGK